MPNTIYKTFSVIVPFYNTEISQIKFCLESLINQDLTLLREIIVVNDGSDEKHTNDIMNLVDEINTHTHTHTHTQANLIKLIHHEINLGLAAARKTGFDYSSHEIIAFVDSDDWLSHNKVISKLNDYFVKNEEVDVITFGCKTTNTRDEKAYKNEGNVKKSHSIKKKIFNVNGYFNDNLKPNTPVAVGHFVYKRKILEDSNFGHFLHLPFEDSYFGAYLLSKQKGGIQTDEIFYIYFKNNKNSITNKLSSMSHLEKANTYTKWFTSFPFNIETSDIARECGIATQIECAITSVGFRKHIKMTKKENIVSPTIKEMKQFIKKYKYYKFGRKLIIGVALYVSGFDYLFPKIYKLIR